ncbi:hypothetical protein ABZU86_12045 [Streptomyces sp. NPDC005271]|uniref:hypothetical protein n=2 Tax=unclassified Streptomyces TaxID=2593676 RepID=UPI0033BA43D5
MLIALSGAVLLVIALRPTRKHMERRDSPPVHTTQHLSRYTVKAGHTKHSPALSRGSMHDDAESTHEPDETYAYDESDERVDQPSAEPDVLLDVPQLKVDEIALDVEDLRARVSLRADVLDLLKLSVGADVSLGGVHLDIKGVEAQALLKVRLDNVAEVIGRVLTTIDRNPQILEQITSGLGAAAEELGGGAGRAVGELGRGAGAAVEGVGEGAGRAVEDVGERAGRAVEGVGEGAGRAVEDVGEGAGRAVEDVGEGAGRAVEDVGEGAGRAVEDVGEGAGQVAGEGARKAVGGVGESARRAAGPGRKTAGGTGAAKRARERREKADRARGDAAPRRPLRKRAGEDRSEGHPP